VPAASDYPALMFVVPALCRCGPMNDILRLCREFVKNDLRPLIFELGKAEQDNLHDEFSKLGINVHTFKGNRWNLALQAVCASKLIRNNKIRIVHSVGMRPDMLNALLKLTHPRLKSVATVVNITVDDTVALAGKLPGLAISKAWLGAFKKMNIVAAHSNGIGDYLSKNDLQKERLRVIPNGVDLDSFPLKDVSLSASMRNELGIAAKDFVIGFVGNLLPVKGLDVLFEALAKLPQEKHWRLLLVGDGPEEGNLRGLAKNLSIDDRIIWAGRQSDMLRYYAAMDIFCLPSRSEGLSNALLEAQASGLPSVVTDIPGSREVVRDDENGFVVPKEDPCKLAEALETMLDKGPQLEHMSGNARRRIAERYSSQSMARDYLQAYDDLG